MVSTIQPTSGQEKLMLINKRSEWLTGWAWLKGPGNDWYEQVTLHFASYEQNEQWHSYLQPKKKNQSFNGNNFAISTDLITQCHTCGAFLSAEERENAQARIFRLLQHEKFAEEMKSLKVGKEILKNSKILQFSPFVDQQGLIGAQTRIGKS